MEAIMRRKRNSLRHSFPHGFTLIELMAVITIIGIIFAVTVPNYAAKSQQARIRAGAQEIAQDFRQIRERSLSLGQRFQVTSPNTRAYQITDPNGNVRVYTLGQATGGNLQFGVTPPVVSAPPEDNDGAPGAFDFPLGILNFESRGGASRGVAYITDGKENYAIGINGLGKIRVYKYDSGNWN